MCMCTNECAWVYEERTYIRFKAQLNYLFLPRIFFVHSATFCSRLHAIGIAIICRYNLNKQNTNTIHIIFNVIKWYIIGHSSICLDYWARCPRNGPFKVSPSLGSIHAAPSPQIGLWGSPSIFVCQWVPLRSVQLRRQQWLHAHI